MSLYSIATASLITADDYKRQPAVSQGMVLRTLTLCLLCAAALVALQVSRGTF